MKEQAWWLTDKESLLEYMREHEIRLKGVHKRVMMKQKGIVGPGIAISFIMRKKIKESDMYGNIIESEIESPTSRFKLKTKRKVVALLGLTQDSSVEDCQRINEEIERK